MFSPPILSGIFSRSNVLSKFASILDPLGMIAPFTFIGKQILQETCRRALKWDEDFSPDLKLTELTEVKITCCKSANMESITIDELHNFSDASTTGYGQCSYLRHSDSHGNVSASLVMAKVRVALTKITTIPRLELSAAALWVKVSKFIAEEFEISNLKVYYWTDSKVVLGYINNESRRFQIFVANRVKQNRQWSTLDQWHFVQGVKL
jgi:hypothetical protein